MRSLFITFGDGNLDFRQAAIRLAGQADSLHLFDSVVSLDHEKLSEAFPKYAQDFASMSRLDEFPLYFRAVKTWVILAALDGVFGEFDVICYVDAGCEVAANKVSRRILQRQLDYVLRNGGLVEQIPSAEKSFTKKSVLEHLHVSDADADSGQLQSTWIMIRNDPINIALVERWRALSDHALDLWQNPTQPELEHSYFYGHRWDQSIFSLLWKAQGLPTKSVNGEWTARLGTLRSTSIPIHTRRNRTGEIRITPLSRSTAVAALGYAINNAIRIVKRNPKPLY